MNPSSLLVMQTRTSFMDDQIQSRPTGKEHTEFDGL